MNEIFVKLCGLNFKYIIVYKSHLLALKFLLICYLWHWIRVWDIQIIVLEQFVNLTWSFEMLSWLPPWTVGINYPTMLRSFHPTLLIKFLLNKCFIFLCRRSVCLFYVLLCVMHVLQLFLLNWNTFTIHWYYTRNCITTLCFKSFTFVVKITVHNYNKIIRLHFS